MANPQWYKIPEISFADYVDCLKDIYKMFESLKEENEVQDTTLKTIVISYYNTSNKEWDERKKQERMDKVFSMKMGDFHECLAGKFNNYEKNKIYGCDVIKSDKTEIWEWKNKYNTLNSKSAETVKNNLLDGYANGYKPFLVFVHCKKSIPRYSFPKSITILNGQQAYHYLSGRYNFFQDLESTLDYTFKKYKKYSKLCKLCLVTK